MGTVTGYYDPDLTILSVSEPLLRGLGYTLDSFMARTGGSLRNMFYGEGASFLEPGRFPRISGRGEGRVLTSDGSPVNAELCKKDATDALGKPIWVMSVHLTWEHENLSLINEAISATPHRWLGPPHRRHPQEYRREQEGADAGATLRRVPPRLH